MPVPTELKFKTEDDRIALMESYSQEPDADPSEIDRIMAAPVDEPDAVVDPDLEEVEIPADAPPEEAPPAEAPPVEAPPADQALSRNWAIKEDDIPKDTYYDKTTGKVRPFITHKDPKDVFKTLIHGQKRIHYLEDVLLPQERQAAADAAKAEVAAEVARLKEENETLKRTAPAAAPSKPDAPAAPAQPAGNVQASASSLGKAIEDLKAINPEDSIENTDKMHAALMASMDHINNLTSTINQLQQSTQAVDGRFAKIEQDRQTDAERQAQAARQNEATQNWQKAIQLVDTFAQTNADFKSEFGNVGQSYGDMTREAVNFHAQLAGLLFNKHPNQVSNQEQVAASQAWLCGDDKLTSAAQQYGFQEPQNYKAWVELDQVDAMRTGMFRDPNTKSWQQMTDPVTRKPVHLGDMETAYGRYYDVSGKRAQKTAAMLKQQQDSLAGAISRRDAGLVSMDPNQLHGDGTGTIMTEQQALETLEQIDGVYAQNQFLGGNKEPFERLNNAMRSLGMQPVEVPE